MNYWIEKQLHKWDLFMLKHEPKVIIATALVICVAVFYVLSKVS